MQNERNIWKDGIMGVIAGDALGCPVQFRDRDEIMEMGRVKGMIGYGTFHMPPGSWTDDSSLTLAALSSIRELGKLDADDIMMRFVNWYTMGEYTPFGKAYDIGYTCANAIESYIKGKDIHHCGGTSEDSNGNGSLMRIMPACLYAYEKIGDTAEAINAVHEISGLTHNHLRSRIGCGLYYFCVCEVLNGKGCLTERLQEGLDKGFSFYGDDILNLMELTYYHRVRDLSELAQTPEKDIRAGGYVVDSLTAAIWGLITTDSLEEALLRIVNLGDDTDSVAAIAGGLAGLYYGYEAIPEAWLCLIQKREWIEGLLG